MENACCFMVRKLERKSLWSRLNLLENVYGAGFYGPLFFWLENWKKKNSVACHVLVDNMLFLYEKW